MGSAMNMQSALYRVHDVWAQNRLGIHVLEQFDAGDMLMDKELFEILNNERMTRVLNHLKSYGQFDQNSDVHLHSISFVPYGVKLMPYMAAPYIPNDPLYLLDLTQADVLRSARLVLASESNIVSGQYTDQKKIDTNTLIPSLRELMGRDGEATLALASDREGGIKRGAKMLDILAEYYEEKPEPVYNGGFHSYKHNELLAALTMDHVLGIAITIWEKESAEPMLAEAMAALNGVSMFFQHKAAGQQKPLFFYDLHQSPEDVISVAAATEGDAKALAMKASELIREVAGRHGIGFLEQEYESLCVLGDMLKTFGIEIYVPDMSSIPEYAAFYTGELGTRKLASIENSLGAIPPYISNKPASRIIGATNDS